MQVPDQQLRTSYQGNRTIPTSILRQATQRCLRQQLLVARLQTNTALALGLGLRVERRSITRLLGLLLWLCWASCILRLVPTQPQCLQGLLYPSLTSNPGTTTGKSGAAAASPFAIGAGLTGTASTGGTTTTKRGNGLFGVRSSKEVPRATPAGQPTTTELSRMDGLRA